MQSVKLRAITQPILDDMPEIKTASDLIAYFARVSNPDNQSNTQTAGRLVKYLADKRHWSPFEMVSLTVEIVTTRDIGRQILRHRSFSFQEFSGRYAVMPDVPHLRECRMQDTKNRQNSLAPNDVMLSNWWERAQKVHYEASRALYETALDGGIAKEQARAVLPEGNIQSSMYMAGTLRSFIHYCLVRCADGVQQEHKEIAYMIRDILVEQFPDIRDILYK